MNLRYKLAPSLIAAGRTVQHQGFPLAARLDLLWPTYPEANNATQYLHLNATLVAPLDVEPVDKVHNTRPVWVPPGDWVDVWSGATVTGPKIIQVTQPPTQLPMWHKRGAVLVTDGTRNNLRLEGQDWSELIIESFPSTAQDVGRREVYEQEASLNVSDRPTVVEITTGAELSLGEIPMLVNILPAPTAPKRSWLVRVHLHHPGQMLDIVDAGTALVSSVQHLQPKDCEVPHFPFRGAQEQPACKAGPVAEFRVSSDYAISLTSVIRSAE